MGGKTYFFFGGSDAESQPAMPDVFFDGKPEHGLPDDPVTGKPRVFGSKQEKARYLQEAGLREAGDRRGGSYLTPRAIENSDFERPQNHDSAMRAIKQVKEMGQDVRRQAYLKIIKESGMR